MDIILALYSLVILWLVLLRVCNTSKGEAMLRACDTEMNPTFHRLESIADMHKFDPYQALHIEDDLDDSIIRLLVSTTGRIWNYHIETKEMEQLFGQPQHGFLPHPFTTAKFNIISGFRQINKTALLVADRKNHCIRLLNRYTGTTHCTIGFCERSGNQDGVKSEALFHQPTKIIGGQYKYEYLIADAGNLAIRRYNLFTTSVETIAHDVPLSLRQDMVLHENRTLLYVAVNEGIALIDLTSPPKEARIQSYQPTPYGIVQIPLTELFLITHYTADKFSIADISVSRQQTVCNWSIGEYVNPDLISCHVDDPISISYSYHLNAFVVSTKQFIKLLNVSYRDGRDPLELLEFDSSTNSAQCHVERQNETLQTRARPTSPTTTTREVTTTTSVYDITTQDIFGVDITSEQMRHIPRGDGLDYGYMPYIAGTTALLSLMIAIIFVVIMKKMHVRKQTDVRKTINHRLLPVKPDRNSAAELTVYEEVC